MSSNIAIIIAMSSSIVISDNTNVESITQSVVKYVINNIIST